MRQVEQVNEQMQMHASEGATEEQPTQNIFIICLLKCGCFFKYITMKNKKICHKSRITLTQNGGVSIKMMDLIKKQTIISELV